MDNNITPEIPAMSRITAREIAVLTIYAMDYEHDHDSLLNERLDPAFYERLKGESKVFDVPPDAKQAEYIRRVADGVGLHLAELDGYIEKYSHGWRFARLPRVSVAILRVAMFEVLYMGDEVPNAAAINAAVELAKWYEDEEMPGYINGVLGTFVRTELQQ